MPAATAAVTRSRSSSNTAAASTAATVLATPTPAAPSSRSSLKLVFLVIAFLTFLMSSSLSSSSSSASPLLALLQQIATKKSVMIGSLLPLFYLLSRQSSLVRYYYRLTLFLLGLGSASIWGVFVSIVLSVVGQSSNINWVVARSFYLMVGPITGISFVVEGEHHLSDSNNMPAVVIGNHQTMIDILYLGRIFPKGCSIMAKKELKYTPLLGQFMTLSNAVFVNRSKRTDAVAVFAKVAETMKEKVLSLFIFPEGTRSASPTPTLLPFKKGPFHLAVQAQLPIIPIVCENYSSAYSAKQKTFAGGKLVIKVLPPIPTIGLTTADVAALSERTRLLMLEALEELSTRRLVPSADVASTEAGESDRLLARNE